ncbi:hypothetical protein [Flavobacterium sp. CS20]|uniref:hypothetical protein n=1 Tax=Flavobacterium sp. CS20 TaxID=2775246 RepID=UPI001B3A6A6E|nr:hypothetical protein [Flavobacterium sp. CS20]QTY28097.1 hypothetical protein IGB25_06305 [Flavobacterium sp. CS20]
MFTKVICHKGFWKSVIFLSIMFILIYNLVDWGMVFNFNLQDFVEERLKSDNLLKFIFANILSGFVYGFIISFFKFRSKLKKSNSTQG